MTFEVINGDCLVELPKLIERGVKADLVFTSPPYNLGNTTGGGHPDRFGHYRKSTGLDGRGGCGKWKGGELVRGYGTHTDDMPHGEYVRWQKTVLFRCWRLLSDVGAIYYNHKPRVLDGQLIPPADYIPRALRKYIRQEVIWARGSGFNFTPSAYVPTHERIVVIAKRGFRLRDKAASGVGDVWYIPPERDNPHPAPFPVELPARAIETTGARLVVDPFCGSGTTGAATVAAGGTFIGIELEARWCDYARARLTRAQGVPATLPAMSGRRIDTPLFGDNP